MAELSQTLQNQYPIEINKNMTRHAENMVKLLFNSTKFSFVVNLILISQN